MARKEFMQTSQLSKQQIKNLMDYNSAIQKTYQDPNSSYISRLSSAVETTVSFVKLFTGDFSELPGLVKSLYEELSSMDARAFAGSAGNGYTGLKGVYDQFQSNWSLVDITYGVLQDTGYDFRIVSSSTIQINSVKIGDSWISR